MALNFAYQSEKNSKKLDGYLPQYAENQCPLAYDWSAKQIREISSTLLLARRLIFITPFEQVGKFFLRPAVELRDSIDDLRRLLTAILRI